MTDDAIDRETGPARGRYSLRRDGAEAELTYSVVSDHKIIADHTGVPDALRGTGAGKALVARMVADARAEEVSIVPLCPFVDAMRRRTPDWADVFTS
ncbi:GNAT family N-acetyltransferase [Tranquillimonas rosea]|uniref:GNAT family N-acetyltransferase n=1 Tax=Tranquillimonas rosea TaxID=641238 RepID=UPI003BAC6753